MQGKDSKRLKRLMSTKKHSEERNSQKTSLSATKLLSQLSMSFYDESTIRKHKQVILDSCLFQLNDREPQSQTLVESGKTKKSLSKRVKKQHKVLEPDQDDIDFRTTQESKMLVRDEEEKMRGKLHKNRKVNSSSKQKGRSLEKFRKQILCSFIQTRNKTPPISSRIKQPSKGKKN